jgi:hypothetical protein
MENGKLLSRILNQPPAKRCPILIPIQSLIVRNHAAKRKTPDIVKRLAHSKRPVALEPVVHSIFVGYIHAHPGSITAMRTPGNSSSALLIHDMPRAPQPRSLYPLRAVTGARIRSVGSKRMLQTVFSELYDPVASS